MDSSISLIITLIMWVALGCLASYLANKRGRDPYAWFAIGIMIGLLGILVLYLLPVKNGDQNVVVEKLPEVIPTEIPLPAVGWYCVDKGSKQQGPLSIDSLKALWKQQEINEKSFVWCEGMVEWKRIEEIPKLSEEIKK